MTEGFLLDESIINKRVKITVIDRNARNKFHEQIKSSDPILAEIKNLHNNIFLYEDIVKIIQDIGSKE